jgi:hypothetical protein
MVLPYLKGLMVIKEIFYIVFLDICGIFADLVLYLNRSTNIINKY